MLPIGPLMIEHRLMERMIALLKSEGDRMERERTLDKEFLDRAIDFIKNYVDRCHHGKEEDILLKQLDKKKVSEEHRRTMEAILEDHRKSRKAVAEMEGHIARFGSGDRGALEGVIRNVRFLVDLYPRHIEMEDRRFFLPCMEYFSKEEKDAMLAKELEFDRNVVHQIYRDMVESQEARFQKERSSPY